MAEKKIILTGGGTAGHVTPNLALVPYLKSAGFEISYIGSKDGIESKLIPDAGIPYYPISTGKLRRYFSLKNFSDPFRVLAGIRQAKKIIKKERPNIIFSKGGFVGLPVAIAGKLCRVPVISHESDMSPGLANKMALPFSKKICCNFPETVKALPRRKSVLTGSPIRSELLSGNREKGLEICNFTTQRPIILVIGGSLGAASVNAAVRNALPKLLPDFQIAHICGKGKLDETLTDMGSKGYIQFEYVTDDLKHLFAMADLVISRAGANSICELVSLKKPNILVPLKKGSRGDQVLNARSFEAQGYSLVVDDDENLSDNLVEKVTELYFTRQTYIDAMNGSSQNNAIRTIVSLIQANMKDHKK
ncbi:MAG: undecaprenyldiphospho-muramoylpentapeptide beta-N-acetylglucosaminyltransferase [Lachnospiraceae bacterium]|nr:undecaprenyldiphospho-muramoylpentapeptide beta-N-acetylglucosaminyltransferase [Lachnospiraceae bacterium]